MRAAPFRATGVVGTDAVPWQCHAVRAHIPPAALTLRAGQPGERDVAALIDMHHRCSVETLFARYHTGMGGSLPCAWAKRLLAPSGGKSVLATVGGEVVGFAQLVTDPLTTNRAEISLLVEDAWQHRGVGVALISEVHRLARAGHLEEIYGLCVRGETGLQRTSRRAGLTTASVTECGYTMVRIAV